ncbi:hypothetical protein FXO37_27382 [Capsicum annuum]|nr:hypothetical protein FXO37_27382 [Capsicum annuum]
MLVQRKKETKSEKNSEDGSVSSKKKRKVSDQLGKPSYSLSDVEVWNFVVRPSDYYMTHVSEQTNCSIENEVKDKLTKNILQLPIFEPVPQKEHATFKKSDGLSDMSKEHMREDSPGNSQNKLKLLRTDLNLVDHISDNVVDDDGDCIDIEAGNKLSANLVDDVEKNVDVGDHIDVVAGDHLSDSVVDDI